MLSLPNWTVPKLDGIETIRWHLDNQAWVKAVLQKTQDNPKNHTAPK
jgi:hypothetical protein